MPCKAVDPLYTLARSRIMAEYESPSPEVRRQLEVHTFLCPALFHVESREL